MAKTFSCLLVGVNVFTVEIETSLGNGFSGLNILGLPSESSRDMRERVRSALESVGISIPARRLVVNITPNDTIRLARTSLTQLDFAVAASIIYALNDDKQKRTCKLHKPQCEYLAGELSLSGELREISNILVYFAASQQLGASAEFCLPKKSESKIKNANFKAFSSLKDWIEHRKIISNFNPNQKNNIKETFESSKDDFKKSLEKSINLLARNPKMCVAILIAACSSSSILIAGEPGVGKSFSLQKIIDFLLPLSQREHVEVELIHGVSHMVTRPFRAPHHSATAAALVGGSSLKPGEVSLAHRGVLFLDELAEFSRSALEALREPLDSRQVCISRSAGNIIYPAHFQLCATTNPCSCGYFFSHKNPCRCNPSESKKYLQKISGPLLDRFDLQVWIDPIYNSENCNVFSEYILKILKENKIDLFIEKYIYFCQNKIDISDSQFIFLQEKIKEQPLFFELSMRGQTRILHLLKSFYFLFEEVSTHKNFINDMFSYRVLQKMFVKDNYY